MVMCSTCELLARRLSDQGLLYGTISLVALGRASSNTNSPDPKFRLWFCQARKGFDGYLPCPTLEEFFFNNRTRSLFFSKHVVRTTVVGVPCQSSCGDNLTVFSIGAACDLFVSAFLKSRFLWAKVWTDMFRDRQGFGPRCRCHFGAGRSVGAPTL